MRAHLLTRPDAERFRSALPLFVLPFSDDGSERCLVYQVAGHEAGNLVHTLGLSPSAEFYERASPWQTRRSSFSSLNPSNPSHAVRQGKRFGYGAMGGNPKAGIASYGWNRGQHSRLPLFFGAIASLSSRA